MVVARSKAHVANMLALGALLAFGVALVASWSVLGDSAFAVKFENGVLPAGTDVASAQAAALVTIAALVFGVLTLAVAAAVRATAFVTTIFVLTLIATPLYVPLGILVYGLAF